MVGRLALVCALALLIVASARTEPLEVGFAQTPPATLTPTATSTATRTATLSPTRTASPTASATPIASVTPAATVTPTVAVVVPTASPTTVTLPIIVGTLVVFPPTPTPTRTPTRTTTVTPTVPVTASPTRTPNVVASPTPISTTMTPSIVPTVTAPLVTGISASSITRSGATISWTTNVPSTSQVEFGTDLLVPVRSALDASLVTSHRQVLTGLTAGAIYHFRVRSAAASSAVGVSADSTFVTAPEGSGPEVVGAAAQRVTSTTALLGWTTPTGGVAQVEYGPTANYGAFTLLKVFAFPTQTMLLTGLRPASSYHFRVNAWDGAGYLSASDDFTFTTATTGLATLLGDQTIQTEHVSLAAGQAAGYQFTAWQSGLAAVVHLYLDAGTTASQVRLALYADQAGAPGTILAQASATGLAPGWLSVNIPPVALLQGRRYWVSVLSPIGGGSVLVRDAGNGGSSLLSSQTTLAAFPLGWTAPISAARSPVSVYVQQAPPAVTVTGPADGAIVTGNVPLSAVVDDDVSIARVQFFVDGLPVGAPVLNAPFTTSWDSAAFTGNLPHIVTAQATDTLGRSSVSAALGMQVDNGPKISGVALSLGLTASSARIDWRTDVPSDAQVEFGTTVGYGSTTPLDARAAWSHEMQLTGLLPGTTYHYRVRGHDANGALAISPDATFATPEP